MIKLAQISPFDYCNNKCWYCPVRYYEQPKAYMVHMSPELMDRVVKNIVDEKGGIVSSDFNFIYTAHYNEIILYKYFAEMLEIFRKYGIKTFVLSNGIAFTKDKIEIIDKFRDVVIGINFNIPSFVESVWADETDNTKDKFSVLVDNVKNVYQAFGDIVSIGMNCVNQSQERVGVAKELFPGMNIYPVTGLCDRAGLLADKNVLSNLPEINRYKEGKTEVCGCRNGERVDDWLHVNAKGEAFICCDDYFFEYTFGDFNNQSLKDIWTSEERQMAIKNAKEKLCSRCAFAIWQ